MKILLADDHILFREALVLYLNSSMPDATILTAGDMHETTIIMADEPPVDLVLLDLRMPGMNGLQGLQKLRQMWPDIPVALMSGVAEPSDVDEAVALGARGYFPKTMPGKILMAGIREILAGGQFLAVDHNTDQFMPSYHDGQSKAETAPAPAKANDDIRFTPRERQVLGFLLHGETNKDIARALQLQIVTVKLHVRGVCRKLGAKNRTQAAVFAREKGF